MDDKTSIRSDVMPRALAALVSSSAFVVPFALSASTSPTLRHPRTVFWYRLLRQPAFKPPDAAIPIVWTAIEGLLAFAGYRLLRRPRTPERDRALGWWALNVISIGAWSRLFFGHRNLPASTVGAAAMVASGAAYVLAARKVDRQAAQAGVPFVAWVAFATGLTCAIWLRNR